MKREARSDSPSRLSLGPEARIRLRGVQAAFCAGTMDLFMVPSELAVAALGGDPVDGVKHRMLGEMGIEVAITHEGASRQASARRVSANRSSRQIGSIITRLAVLAAKGSRFAPLVAKRAYVVITLGSAAYAAVSAYRDTTAVGFSALGSLQRQKVADNS